MDGLPSDRKLLIDGNWRAAASGRIDEMRTIIGSTEKPTSLNAARRCAMLSQRQS